MKTWSALALLLLAASGDDVIGMRVSFDRPTPLYAASEPVILTIHVEKPARIEVWRASADGVERRVLSSAIYGGALEATPGRPLTLVVAGPPSSKLPVGVATIHVIARAIAAGAGDERSLGSADQRLAGRAQREDRRIQLEVVP